MAEYEQHFGYRVKFKLCHIKHFNGILKVIIDRGELPLSNDSYFVHNHIVGYNSLKRYSGLINNNSFDCKRSQKSQF